MRRPEFFFKSELCFVCFIRTPENVFTSTIAYLLSVSNCLWMAFDRFCSKLVIAFELDGEFGQEMYFVFFVYFRVFSWGTLRLQISIARITYSVLTCSLENTFSCFSSHLMIFHKVYHLLSKSVFYCIGKTFMKCNFNSFMTEAVII